MPCSHKPNYTPHDFMNLSPAYQWGIGRAVGYTHFNRNEFSQLVGESHINWEINFNDRADGKKSPHKITVENKNHIYHNNILRGSKYLANPVLLFNGASYVENAPRDDSAIAMTQAEGQGLMFYWDDFTGDYGVMKAGDDLTITVDVRVNGTTSEAPMGSAELVRLKATPNFSPSTLVTSQSIGNGFTRLIFRTKVLNTTWTAPSNWEETWGVTNPSAPTDTGRTWNKDRLIGVVQNVNNVQLEMTRPQVSREGATTYQEASLDIMPNNQFTWTGMNKGYRLIADGKYVKSDFAYEWANPKFFKVPTGTQWQRVRSVIAMKFTKLPFTPNTDDAGNPLNVYGKVVWYSGASEASVIKADTFWVDDGKYGGKLSEILIPEGATHYRIHITAFSQQSVDFKFSFTDVSYVNNSSATAEITRPMYQGVTKMLDGSTALAYADNFSERVKIDYVVDLVAEIKKALPKAFEGLSLAESVTRVRSMAYMMNLTMTARGGDTDNVVHWHMKNKDGVASPIHNFSGAKLTTHTHRSTWQDWIRDDGTMWGYIYTEAPPSGVGEQAWVELDYFKIDITIVATNEDIEAWEYNSKDSRYKLTSVDIPMARTEENMQNSSVQVTHGFDIYGEVFRKYPEFFGDCYTYEDCINKLNERIESVTFEYESVIPDPDIGGLGYVNFVVEAEETSRDFTTRHDKNTANVTMVTNGLSRFIQENGYIYFGAERPAEDRNIELGMISNISFQLWMDKDYDNDKRIFRYNKKKQPWFLFVRDIQRSVLPPKVNNLVDVNRGRNRYSYGQTETARSITLQCFIKAPSEQELAPLLEELADYLDVGETTLQLYDAPERVYKVVLDGSTDISQTLHMGEISLTFVLLDNYAIGKEVVVQQSIDASGAVPYINLENEGTAPTHPTYLLDFKQRTQFVDLIGQGDSENISIGRRSSSSSGDTPKDLRPRVFYSKFTPNDGATWFPLSEPLMPEKIEAKSPTLQGSVQRSNGMINQNKWDYGDAAEGWHGHGAIGTLTHNVNNFVCEATAAMLGAPPKNSLNGFFLIFYDDANTPIARVKFGTRTADGHLDSYIVDDGEVSHWGNGKRLLNQGATKLWDNFQGKVIVERKNNQWRLTVGQFKDRRFDPAPEALFNMGSSMLKDTKSTGWLTLDSSTWDRPVARIGVFMCLRDKRPKLGHVSLRRLIVWEDLTDESTSVDEEPIMLNVDDQVAIDSDKGQVYLNGVLTPKLVDPMTDWFALEKGENLVGVNNFVGDLTVIYNERFK